MNNEMLAVLVHNALHAGSREVAIPDLGRVLPIHEYPLTGVRSVIVTDASGVRHEFMTQNKDEQSYEGALARLGLAITRERTWVGTHPGNFTNRGVLEGRFTHSLQAAVQRELDRRTIAVA